jgi:hypothetical protein
MPINEPPVDQTFINLLASFAWQTNGSLKNVDGVVRWVAVVSNAWVLAATGLFLQRAAYDALKGARAQSDGSFIATTGIRYRLGVVEGQAEAVQQP